MYLLFSDQNSIQRFISVPNEYNYWIFQVKVAILKYIESLARQMDPTDFVNSSETRLAVSRIITWTTEPKSSDVRKVCPRELKCSFKHTVLRHVLGKEMYLGTCTPSHTPTWDPLLLLFCETKTLLLPLIFFLQFHLVPVFQHQNENRKSCMIGLWFS